MKIKIAIICILSMTSPAVIAQRFSDSSKTKVSDYSIGFAANYGMIVYVEKLSNQKKPGYYNYQLPQFELNFGAKIKRSQLSIGILGGPVLSFSSHYVNGNNLTGKSDYFTFDPSFSKWGLFGGNLLYQYCFSETRKRLDHRALAYYSYSSYNNILDYGNPMSLEIYRKQINQLLFGYSISKRYKRVEFGFQSLAGLFFNKDTKDVLNNPLGVNELFHKLFFEIQLRIFFSIKL